MKTLLAAAATAAVFMISCASGAAQPAAGPIAAPETPVPPPAASAPQTPAPAAELPAPAPQMTVAQLLDKMEAARQVLKTFRCQVFKQHKELALDFVEESTGALEFKMPRLLRMELMDSSDKRRVICIVGPQFGWIYRPERKFAERVEMRDIDEKDVVGNPLNYGLARDIHSLQGAYDLKLLPQEKVGEATAIPLELTPKEEGSAGKLIFWIDARSWLPIRVRQYKSNNEIIETHTFSNVETNVPLDDKIFEFKLPPGVDWHPYGAETPR